jgi:CHAT domain-containing protein
MHKPLFRLFTALVFLLIACRGEVPTREMRTVEPRLSGSWAWQPCEPIIRADRVVTDARCATAHTPPQPVSLSAEDCDDMTIKPIAVLDALATRSGCTDAVVGALEGIASRRNDAASFSDLGAAYYVRAQRKDQPKDLLLALEQTRKALVRQPRHPQALFNHALTLEALHLNEAAVKAWEEAGRASAAQWRGDAAQHRNRLVHALAGGASVQWPLVRAGLTEAVATGNRSYVEQTVKTYPGACQQYVEEQVLPRWAATNSPEQLGLAEAIATALAGTKGGDRYLLDVVNGIKASARDPQQIALLRAGLRKFGEARDDDRRRATSAAEARYDEARRLLTRADSPLRISATVGFAIAASFGPRRGESIPALDVVHDEARHRYPRLLAWIEASRAFCHIYAPAYTKSLAEYETALARYESLQDPGEVGKMHSGMAGVLRVLGQRESAWREGLHSLQFTDPIVEAQQRHRVRGEAAAAAVELGFIDTALQYQNVTVDMLQQALKAVPAGLAETEGLSTNLSIALRSRAGMEVESGDLKAAARDLDAAKARLPKPKARDVVILRSLEARIDEVLGQSALASKKYDAAIAAFSRALTNGPKDEYATLRVRLYVQRADARRRAEQLDGAAEDLRLALATLSAEETKVLASRRRGDPDEVLNIYFSRFDETYDLLIDQLVAERREREAFDYAERARAVEPLSLIMQLKTVPSEFRDATQNGPTLSLPQIQAALPAGTFVLQYRVTPVRTYVWIITRDGFATVTLRDVNRNTVEAWTATLQDSARARRAKVFNAALTAPFEGLLREPLEQLRKLPGGAVATPRLVIIPDGPMHGLPFAALQDTSRRHLIEQAVLAVDGSATLYVYSLMRDRDLAASPATTALLIGDPAFADAPGVRRLPAAATEVENIRAFYPGADVLRDTEATVPRFLKAAPSSTIIHFGGHAITISEAPSHSLLLLAPSGKDNGHLTALDLLQKAQLDQTRLFVLAACSSAGGAPVGPDGLAPLVRPLIAAGVPAVAGSLWDVEDTTAQHLLEQFHRHFSQGLDAAAALRKAQLEALRDRRAGLNEPLVWAPYQVIGYASSPFATTSNQKQGDSPQ